MCHIITVAKKKDTAFIAMPLRKQYFGIISRCTNYINWGKCAEMSLLVIAHIKSAIPTTANAKIRSLHTMLKKIFSISFRMTFIYNLLM